jgi:hypothetical protein
MNRTLQRREHNFEDIRGRLSTDIMDQQGVNKGYNSSPIREQSPVVSLENRAFIQEESKDGDNSFINSEALLNPPFGSMNNLELPQNRLKYNIASTSNFQPLSMTND